MDMQRGFRIGPWSVSPLTGEIESGGRSVHLEPKVMEVLVVLAEKAETVVLREELLDRIWGPRAAISDEPLTRCIAQLRQSLGDSSRDPSFIQTVPKRGYRLMLPIVPLGDTPAPVASARAPDAAAPPLHSLAGRGSRPRPWQGIVLTGTLAVLGLVAYVALTLMEASTGFVDPCNIEAHVDAALPRIDPAAYDHCVEGVDETNTRDANAIRRAIRHFQMALDIQPGYGSAIVQLARAYALLQTYDAAVFPEDCPYDDNEPDPIDCYDGAIKLLHRNRDPAWYIHDYAAGVEGYVLTKQGKYRDARAAFTVAVSETPLDADMWQWYSQFLAAVGDLDGARVAIDEAVRLNPDSPVIRDRAGVVYMWLDLEDEARAHYAAAAAEPHEPYEASDLVWTIRERHWLEVEDKLLQIAGLNRRSDDTVWIGPFVAGIRDRQDPAALGRAIAAVDYAIEKGYLKGQYEYGAWVYLGETERAFLAAKRLIGANRADFDVEFLFAPETEDLREHPRFEEIPSDLGLLDYWSDGPANCPPIFAQWGKEHWCG
jgi:DNA-binding winged helix-turn-helix (wHTH) protein/tetratricopeptide (TPR) repeat protein